jgi:prepilin-type N-terminal cleavage/methylation domain-containing protein
MNDQFKNGRRNPQTAGAAVHGFTLIEMLVVIAIIGILAGIIISVVGVAATGAKERRAKAALQEIVTAIEAYHAATGSYPPDNRNNPAQPPLYYELVATSTPDNGMTYTTIDGRDSISQPDINTYFSAGGFMHTVTSARGKTFLKNLDPKKHGTVPGSPGVQVLVMPVEGPNASNPKFNPYYYVSSHPTNNPKTYDLWAEVVIRGRTIIIGNWK